MNTEPTYNVHHHPGWWLFHHKLGVVLGRYDISGATAALFNVTVHAKVFNLVFTRDPEIISSFPHSSPHPQVIIDIELLLDCSVVFIGN